MTTMNKSAVSLTLLLVSLATGCGGGGGGSSGSSPSTGYSLSGRAQKGPLAVGSSITINEVGATLSPTGKVYDVQTSDALGDFSVSSSIGTQQVEIAAQGFYTD